MGEPKPTLTRPGPRSASRRVLRAAEPVRQGDRVTRGTVLTTVDDTGALEVYVGIPVQQAVDLKLGLAVRILGDDGQTLATERISFIAPAFSSFWEQATDHSAWSDAAGR